MMGLRALIVVALFAGPALAQDAQKQKAGELVKAAIAKSQAGDHEGAIKLYLEAYDLVPNPILLSNVGSEYQQLKTKPVEAMRYFCMYLEKDPTGTNVTYVTAQTKVLQVELKLKDAEVCAKPKPVEPPPEPKPVPTVTATEKPIVEPPPAGHPGKGLRTAGLVIGGVGVVTLGTGLVFGYKALQNANLITDHDPTMRYPSNLAQIQADGQSYENKQILFTVAGGVVTATGIVVYVIGRSKKSSKETSVSIVPTATPDSFGVTLGGAY